VAVGAIFLIVLAAIVIAIGCVFLFGLLAKLRHEKMHPQRDKIEEPHPDDDAGGSRPRHARVRSEEHSHFVPDR
jgi:hypothetical protein